MALSRILAAHRAEVVAMFARAQTRIDDMAAKPCSCDHCRYPLTVSIRRATPRQGPIPIRASRASQAPEPDPLLKGIYARSDRSGYDATGGLPRILARPYPEGFRDFLFELHAVDQQAPGPVLRKSSTWLDARAKLNQPLSRCSICQRDSIHPALFVVHSKGELDYELDGYSRYPTQEKKPGKKPLKRAEARLAERQPEDDLERYNEYSDERADREKQHDIAAYQQWRRGLPLTLNLPTVLRHLMRYRLAVAFLDLQRRDSLAASDYVTDRIAIRVREVELWAEERQRNQDALDDRWLAERLGLTAPREREAFRNHLQGASLAVIATLMGVEVSTVKEWLKRARQQLRKRSCDPWNLGRVPLARTFKYEESPSAYERKRTRGGVHD